MQMFHPSMNHKKPGLESKNLNMRAVSANTPKKQNVAVEQKNEITRQVVKNRCKSSLVQSKWPTILRQHIEMLDSHIKFLDQSMKVVKCEKPNKVLDSGAKEPISSRVIFRVMDAAKEALTRSRVAALPVYEPLDDKDQDQEEYQYQSLETVSRWDRDIAPSRAADTISKLDSSSIGPNDMNNQTAMDKMTTPPYIGMNKLSLSKKSKKPMNKTAHNIQLGEEQRDNKRIKADVERFTATPSRSQILDATKLCYTGPTKKKKKNVQLVEPEQSIEPIKAAGSQRETTTTSSMTNSTDTDVDFTAIEIKLQEEIAAGERAAKEVQRSSTFITSLSPAALVSRKKKRRRCSSDDLSRVRQAEKKLRREELEKNLREKKRKVDETEIDKEVNDHKRKKIRKIPKREVIQND